MLLSKPSSPYFPKPQEKAFPLLFKATAWYSLKDTSFISFNLGINVGVSTEVISYPKPNKPSLLWPQTRTLWYISNPMHIVLFKVTCRNLILWKW